MHISIYIKVLITSLQTSYAHYGVYTLQQYKHCLANITAFQSIWFPAFFIHWKLNKLGSSISSVITGDSRQILFYAWKEISLFCIVLLW